MSIMFESMCPTNARTRNAVYFGAVSELQAFIFKQIHMESAAFSTRILKVFQGVFLYHNLFIVLNNLSVTHQ